LINLALDDWSNLQYDSRMKNKTNDTRQHILDTGYQLIVAKGFTSVGLSQLLKHADVPKGSFYHYFKSKEQFGEALIDDYFSGYKQRIETLFSNVELSGYERMLSYWTRWVEQTQGICGAEKCLVVKLSSEVSDLSEPMRLALLKGADDLVSAIESCLEAGKQDGSIKVNDCQEAARNLYQLWLGASVLYKLSKDPSGLQKTLKTTELILHGKVAL